MRLLLVALRALWPLCLTLSVQADDSAWRVPGDLSELRAACEGQRGLETFANSGYHGIELGTQAVLLGSRLPIGPAPHVAWAKPYVRGPIKLLIITSVGYSAADIEQLAQVTRALHAEVRWLLLSEAAVTYSEMSDERYRTQYLPEQARAVLREDFDAILMTFGTYTPAHGVPAAHPLLPDDVYRAILAQVARGTGLVLVGQWRSEFWPEHTPLSDALPARMSGEHVKLFGPAARLTAEPPSTAFAGLSVAYDAPWFSADKPLVLYAWQLRPGARVLARIAQQPAVMTRDYGRGRVLLLGWDGTLGPERNAGRAELEHAMVTGLRAIAFAARKEPDYSLELSTAPLTAGEPGRLIARASRPARLELSVRGDTFRPLHSLAVQLRAGDNAVPVPALAKGRYWLQIIAKNPHGQVLYWGDQTLDVQAPFGLDVQTDRETYGVGERVEISARSSGLAADPTLQATLEVRDAAGRVLARETRPFEALTRFTYSIRAARVAPHKATVVIARAGSPLMAASAPFFVPMARWDDYENVLWSSHSGRHLHPSMRDAGGFTAVFDMNGGDEAVRAAAHYGLRGARMNDAVLSAAQLQTQPLAAALASEPSLTRAIAVAQRYGALFWVLQDERGQLQDPGAPDAEGLARYRNYLRKHYGSLAALNASWGSGHVSWDQVRPTLTAELPPAAKNLAPWVDFRLFAADQAFELDVKQTRRIRQALGEQTPVGLDGFTSSRQALPYAALDFGRLAAEGVFNFYSPYADDLLFASLIKGPKAKYLGWSMSRSEYFGAPWRDAFRGHGGTLRFFGPTFWSDFGFLQPAGRWTGEGTRELRAGVGKLLLGSERELSPVVLLYSYASLVTGSGAGAWEPRHGNGALFDASAESRAVLEQLLLGEGVAPGYLTEAQLASGALAGKKLLILPRQMSVALSRATTRAIEQFVRDGGTVLADLAPALCDEHGKPQPRAALDGLFGVRAAAESIVHAPHEYGAGVLGKDALVPQGEWLLDEWYDQRLSVTDGRAAGQHVADGAPAFIVKQTGRGRSLLLNTLLHSVLPQQGIAGPEQRALLRTLLKAAGVEPLARVVSTGGAPASHCEVNRLRDGANSYVGFYAHSEPEGDAAQVQAVFSDDKETYDVRAGRYLGRTRQVALPLRAREAALFARLDYRLTGLSLEPPPRAIRGELVRVPIVLSTSAPAGRHVVHVELSGPGGAPLPLYTQNVVLQAGRGELQLSAALNDRPGLWQINVREVVSGLNAVGSIELQ